MATQQRKRRHHLGHYLFFALGACLLVGCPRRTSPPLPPGNVPPCGPRLARQQLLIGFNGPGPFPPIDDVRWTITTYCLDTSQGRTFVHSSATLGVFQTRVGTRFTENPPEGFEGLGMGRVLEHVEGTEINSITLADAQQANWCIRGVVRFRDNTPPSSFGPFTARQVAGTSPFLLNFVGTLTTTGGVTTVTFMPGFDAMNGCVNL